MPSFLASSAVGSVPNPHGGEAPRYEWYPWVKQGVGPVGSGFPFGLVSKGGGPPLLRGEPG